VIRPQANQASHLERKLSAQKETRLKRIKDIVWTAVTAVVITVMVTTSLG
jgi:hypothetical protein